MIEDDKKRLLRFLVRMDTYKNNPVWTNAPEIVGVCTNGTLDKEKLRATYEKRGFLKGEEFDAALDALETEGFVKVGSLDVNQSALSKKEEDENNDILTETILNQSKEF